MKITLEIPESARLLHLFMLYDERNPADNSLVTTTATMTCQPKDGDRKVYIIERYGKGEFKDA